MALAEAALGLIGPKGPAKPRSGNRSPAFSWTTPSDVKRKTGALRLSVQLP
jgi:hypothetical protein